MSVYSLDPAPSDALYAVVRPAAGSKVTHGRFGRVYGFSIWLAVQDYSKFDVVHAMGDNCLLNTRVPVVRTIHGAALAEAVHADHVRTKIMFLSVYALELVGVARAAIAVGVSRNSVAYFPWVKNVILESVDLKLFSPSQTKSPLPSILFVGHRLHDRKRADYLIDVYSDHVRAAVPNAELWLVCDDSVETPGVHWFSKLDTAELAELYRRAWVFCLPSSYEGFGRPYLESMASGTPVVATMNPGAMEVLAAGQYGIIAADRRLGDELVNVLRDENKRRAMTSAGLERAKMFDWDLAVDAYENLYYQLAHRRL
jgi:glycosyltransferase involved in cell wall biosynthesis